ncbi:hypothetical protein GCM10022251_77810 [Phytohabitans flavus]|uniref:Uncharacterized protein n=1 Tax=Phytohabitans flavus TaxID=1076124 RepID=A0A6F8XNR5_9ACTN|nr:hypothetical protein [Phytohabitans flavus]BCB75408.1 hypothetical protein Pflav_018180 [Phytohabitans flavus]
MGRDVVVPLTVALVSGLVSFLTGVMLTRHRARVDAQQQYQLQARQRLYEAVGPLRFQLVVACREVASRVESLHKRRYRTAIDGYFGQNTLYRLLRPLALAELIERQTNYVDFSVDRASLVLLRFRAASYDALTGGGPVFHGLPLDWTKEAQHVFAGRLQHAATLLVIEIEDQPPRCARFDEFPALLQAARQADPTGGMARLAALVDGTSPGRDPVFWCRLVAYGYVANWLLSIEGRAAGYNPVPYPVTNMLSMANIAELSAIAEDMPRRLESMIEATPGESTASRSRRW